MKTANNHPFSVFYHNDKRGYISTLDGKVIIPEQYAKALIFFDDVAAAMKDGLCTMSDEYRACGDGNKRTEIKAAPASYRLTTISSMNLLAEAPLLLTKQRSSWPKKFSNSFS